MDFILVKILITLCAFDSISEVFPKAPPWPLQATKGLDEAETFPTFMNPQVFDSDFDLDDLYTFYNITYHALGEYSSQLMLKDFEKKYGVDYVNNATVLNVLTTVQIDVPGEIENIWKTLEYNEKRYLVDIVKKQIPKIKGECKDHEERCGRLEITGTNIFLSDVFDLYNLMTATDDIGTLVLCNCFLNAFRWAKMEVSVIAEEKFFWDSSLNETDNLMSTIFYLSIIAPVWEVIPTTTGYRELIFSTRKASSGAGFFGVHSEIINVEQLFIQANGGDGCTYAEFLGKKCGLDGGNSGTVYLVSTGKNVTVYNETLPGNPVDDRGQPGNVKTNNYKPSHGIAVYIAAFGENLILGCYESEAENFYWKLRVKQEFSSLYTPMMFAKELETLERNYSNWKAGNYSSNCPFDINTRMNKYYERLLDVLTERLNWADESEKLGYAIIGSYVTSKLMSLRRLEKTLNVVSTEKYLEALESDLKMIEKLQLKVAITRETEEYKNALNEKVKEAEQLINDTVQPAIKRAEAALTGMNAQLLKTIKAFLDAAQADKDKAEQMKKEFQKMLPFKYAMSTLKLVGTAVAILAPGVGPVVGGAIVAGATIGSSFLDGQGSFQPLVPFTKQLVNDSDAYWEEEIKKITPDDPNDTPEIKELKKKKAKWAKGLTMVAGMTEGVLTFVSDIQSTQAQGDQLDQAIAAADAQVKAMERMQDQFHNGFAPMLDRMTGQVSDEASKLNGSSHASLTVKKFGLKNELKKMQKLVKSFVGPLSEAQDNSKDSGGPIPGEPGIYENFLGCIDTLEEALVVLFEMYTHIETYQERKQMAQFIANVNSPSSAIDAILGTELGKVLRRFELQIRTNLLLEEFKKAEHAFRQFVFPFARDYLMPNNDPFSLAPYSNATLVLEVCRTQIRNFLNILQKFNAITTVDDEFVFYANFTSRLVSRRPFFVWGNELWNSTIYELFEGKAVQLKSECNMTFYQNAEFFVNKTAIKFKGIRLFIRARDPSLQEDLDEVLKNFRISMTHSGISLYLVNQKQFIMRDRKQTYSYNFENDASQNAIRYKGTAPHSDFLMSPYSWWTLKMSDETGIGFEELKRFASDVDLELEGLGSYLNEEAGAEYLNELHVSDFYETFDSTLNASEIEDNGDDTEVLSMRRYNQLGLPNTHLDSNLERYAYYPSYEASTSQIKTGNSRVIPNSNVKWRQDGLYDFNQAPRTSLSNWYGERTDEKQNRHATSEEEEPRMRGENERRYFEPESEQETEQQYEEENEREKYEEKQRGDEEKFIRNSNYNFPYPGK